MEFLEEEPKELDARGGDARPTHRTSFCKTSLFTNRHHCRSQPLIVDWAAIPVHLLDLILDKLESTVDLLQFGAVCDAWNSTTKEYIKFNETTRRIPMLLIPNREEPPTCSVYDITRNKFLRSKLSVPFKKRFAGSSRGWLVAVHEDWTVSLYKPFSRVVDPGIRLPSLFPPDPSDDDPDMGLGGYDPWTVKDYHIKKVVITADPLENPEECVVFAIFEDCGNWAFIRPRQDSPNWTKINVEEYGMVHDIVQSKSQLLYMVDFNDDFYSLDLARHPYSDSNLTPMAPCDSTSVASVNRYIVESYHGKFYQVKRYFEFIYADQEYEGEDTRFTTRFEVAELDPERGEWIEVKSLKDEALFLGSNSSISVKASNFGGGCEQDCIYYTHDLDNVYSWGNSLFSDFGIYHVQSKEFNRHFTIDPLTLKALHVSPPIWVVPTFDA